MIIDNVPKSKYYVPKLYLKNFTTKRDKKSPTYVFDFSDVKFNLHIWHNFFSGVEVEPISLVIE